MGRAMERAAHILVVGFMAAGEVTSPSPQLLGLVNPAAIEPTALTTDDF